MSRTRLAISSMCIQSVMAPRRSERRGIVWRHFYSASIILIVCSIRNVAEAIVDIASGGVA